MRERDKKIILDVYEKFRSEFRFLFALLSSSPVLPLLSPALTPPQQVQKVTTAKDQPLDEDNQRGVRCFLQPTVDLTSSGYDKLQVRLQERDLQLARLQRVVSQKNKVSPFSHGPDPCDSISISFTRSALALLLTKSAALSNWSVMGTVSWVSRSLDEL
jgi:hypothetical protein